MSCFYASRADLEWGSCRVSMGTADPRGSVGLDWQDSAPHSVEEELQWWLGVGGSLWRRLGFTFSWCAASPWPTTTFNKRALRTLSVTECLLCARHFALTVDKNMGPGTRLLRVHLIQHSLSPSHSASLCHTFLLCHIHVTIVPTS